MFFAIILVFALGVSTGTVVDNQLHGKIGNAIVGTVAPAPAE